MAEPFVLEARLGLLRLRRSQSSNVYSVPLLRLNYGLPGQLELQTEAEFDASEGHLGDAAAGLKWVPWVGRLSFGIEALVLLPVNAGGGAGAESQALMTARLPGSLLHLNAGGTFDTRPAETETGWRAGVVVEAVRDGWRPGLELFLRRFEGAPLEAVAGMGVIVAFGRVDVRLGADVGLTPAAPTLVLDLWIASKLRTRAAPNGAGSAERYGESGTE